MATENTESTEKPLIQGRARSAPAENMNMSVLSVFSVAIS